MVAMAGKYIVYIEKNKLILMHPAGISFDLTREDAMELAVLVSNWQRAIRMGLYESELEGKQTMGSKTTESTETVADSLSESL